MTVEAVLIVPMIIFVLFWLINVAFVLYQYAFLQSVADQAVEAAQRGWDNTSKDISTGMLASSAQLDDEGLFWNVVDNNADAKTAAITAWVQTRVSKDPLMSLFSRGKPSAVSVSMNHSSLGFLRRGVDIAITDSRRSMFSSLRTQFGFSPNETVTVRSRGTIQDPAEFIRTLDFGADTYNEYIEKNPDGALGKITEKLAKVKDTCIETLEK